MRLTRGAATAALGILGMLCTPAAGRAQGGPVAEPPVVSRIASLAPGGIDGVVLDEHGKPLAGAMVSALGATTKVAVTDASGRFVLRTLNPGPYILRAHLTGFIASRTQIVEVRPSARASSSIELRHAGSADDAPPILAAGFGGGLDASPDPAVSTASGGDNHGETAWRIRHTRRGVLKDADAGDVLVADEEPPTDVSVFGPMTTLGRAVSSPARAASALFAGTPFSGQLNLLTTGSFDTPQQLFTTDSFAHGVAYLSVGSSVGNRGDWAFRGALTQGDLSSWIVAGSYASRAAGPHHYEFGMTYATQRYDGGNPAALRSVTDGSRNAGTVFALDSWTFGRTLAVTYGGRYSSYDYLDGRGLLSPRASVTVAPASPLRLSASVASRAVAPGAEEFLPPTDGDLWLPPQRTFSSLVPGRTMTAERTTSGSLELERDLGTSTVAFGAFRQVVDDQLVTVFGAAPPEIRDTPVGHYYVGNNGNVDVTGWSASFSAALADRVHAALRYSVSRAQWSPSADLAYLLLVAPSTLREQVEHVQDLTASVETTVPETATRVLVFYRVSNGFASRDLQAPGLDSRFDVQVRQSLPFMNFSAAQWEMLVAVRNFFREAGLDQSLYDELLVVHPPKRIVGGLTLRF